MPTAAGKISCDTFNSSADLSPTGAQMPRLVGLALASKLYRQLPELQNAQNTFSSNGNEIAFGTIGNAACAEGVFWESINAIGVLQVPMLLAIWDDGYGISVPNELQITKADISNILDGFQRRDDGKHGIALHKAQGWNYEELCAIFSAAADDVRRNHEPAIVHVTELTQPQGHSTSGSQERYKPADRLKWERAYDCLRKMREWIIEQSIATSEHLNELEEQERARVLDARDRAWLAFRTPIEDERRVLLAILQNNLAASSSSLADRKNDPVTPAAQESEPPRPDVFGRRGMEYLHETDSAARRALHGVEARRGAHQCPTLRIRPLQRIR